jgi:hypothetical protein
MIITKYSTILSHAPVHGFASYKYWLENINGMEIGSASHKCQGLYRRDTKLTYIS